MIRFWHTAPTVEQALRGPHNHFTLLRLLLAVAVVVSHSFSVSSGSLLDEPLRQGTGFTLGEHAVNGFFAISGFLVTMSFDRRGWLEYVVARTLRILPGFLAAVALVILAGAALSRLPLADFLGHAETWRFARVTITGFKSATSLPGLYADNPIPFPMATIWTLRYEVFCYLGVLVLGVVGALRIRVLGPALVAGLFAALIVVALTRAEVPKSLETALRLPLIFAFGGALYAIRERARLSGAILLMLALATWLSHGTALYQSLLFTATSYGVLFLALAPAVTRIPTEPGVDLSYGVYLYGWPVQQTLHSVFPEIGPVAMLVPALAATGVIAALSWYLVEKPALGLKARMMRRAVPLSAPRPAAS